MNLSRRTVVWLIPILLTLHNAEEAVAFTRMRSDVPAVLPGPFAALESQLTTTALLQALAGLSAVAFVLAASVALRAHNHIALWLLLALEAAMVINVGAHLGSAVLLFHGYGPGLVTAVLVNGPFGIYVLRRARREEWVNRRAWNWLACAGLLLHGPVLMGVLWLATRR